MTTVLYQRLLKSTGWKIVNANDSIPSCIMIVYPHTSNWDFVIGMLAKGALGQPCHWLGKKELFWWPVNILMRALGGIAVDRKNPDGLIEDLSERFQSNSNFVLIITPEGTRSFRPTWKSGFYRLATATKTPIVMVSMDFPSKTIVVSSPLELTGDSEQDLPRIQTFYQGVEGKFPALAAPIRISLPELQKTND